MVTGLYTTGEGILLAPLVRGNIQIVLECQKGVYEQTDITDYPI